MEFPMAPTLSWDCIPEEVLWMILKRASSKCLLSCMFVSKRWKLIVLDYIKFYSLWPKIASEAMVNNGRTYKRKSVLNSKDMVLTSLLWPFVSEAKIDLHYSYAEDNITSIQVLKDNLIMTVDMLTTTVPIRYYDIPNTKLKYTLHNITAGYGKVDVRENEYMRVIVEHDVFYAFGKQYPDDPINRSEMLLFFKIDVLVYTLEANCCYIVTNRHVIWAFSWDLKRWQLKSRGRYYGSMLDIPCGISLYNDRICVVTKPGFILCEDRENMLYQKQNNYNLVTHLEHSTILVLFSQKGVAISVSNSEERVKFCQEKETNVVWLECGDMTCATEHGEVLFIGYQDGTVAICTPHAMSPTNNQVDRLFNVKEFNDSIVDPAILRVEVFEDVMKHHLLVAVKGQVLQLLITYPDHILSLFE